MVKNAWEEENVLLCAIEKLTSSAKQWNRLVFGNLFARKRRVVTRINGAQKALSSRPNHFFVQLEQDLIKEYLEIM